MISETSAIFSEEGDQPPLINFEGSAFSASDESEQEAIKNTINTSRTVLWNGPAGYFENSNFANGSYEIAKKITEKNKENSIYSVAGGGDTIAVLNQINVINYFNFVSTAGGAFLEYLEGKD